MYAETQHIESATAGTASVIRHESTMTSWDGAELFYRAWLPRKPFSNAVVLFHGGHEHSGRFQDLVDRLALSDFGIFAWDARGHGHTPGVRGDANHFQDYVRDADAFVRFLSVEHGVALEKIVVIGHSVGSVIAATWVNDYAPPIRAMVLGSPAFKVKLYVPAALPALRLIQKLNPNARVNSYVKPSMLTHDKEEAEARRIDPLISPRISVKVLTSLFDTSERVINGASGIKVPTLLFSAGSDWVVHKSAHRRFINNLGSRIKVLRELPGFYHEIFHEKARHTPIRETRQFILDQFEERGNPLSQIGIAPCNSEDYRNLQKPLSPLSFSYWKFLIIRMSLRSIGRLSQGVRLGWTSGFDSGRTLDYVYANQPAGFGPVGRLIDRTYLNSTGWAGIRRRRLNLEAHLDRAIDELKENGSRVHVVDVAGGPGRYLAEVLRRRQDPELSAVCRDMDSTSLEGGRKLALAYGVTQLTHEPGNAFDPASIASLSPRPDIVIVSGLYELFQDNTIVLRSLRAIYEQMAPGARLVYTNQPYHPQLELIARTLVSRGGDPWTMRLRPQSEMSGLVKLAGFRTLATSLDDAGIFSVSTAIKEI